MDYPPHCYHQCSHSMVAEEEILAQLKLQFLLLPPLFSSLLSFLSSFELTFYFSLASLLF